MELKAGKLFAFLVIPILILCASATAFAAAGDIHTYMGIGVKGYSGDGGPATTADMAKPFGVAVDAAGNVYVSDSANQRIREVDAGGVARTVAGTGVAGFSGDGGPASAAKVYNPAQIAVDAAGNVYFADSSNNRVRKITPAGVISTVAGNGTAGLSGNGGPATAAALKMPQGVAVDALGNLFISDTGNNCVRRVDKATGIITRYAGTTVAGYSGDGGSAKLAAVNYPEGLAFDGYGNLYIADYKNHRVRRVTPTGIITTVAGTGVAGYSGDGGSPTAAKLNYPSCVAVGPTGKLYIADRFNQRIRMVYSGKISTIAGNGTPGFSGDGGQHWYAMLNYPFSVAINKAGNIFIGDNNNFRVRMIEGAYPLPTSQITSPAYGASVSGAVTVSGKASGPNGVAYVQFSHDGGDTWATASGTTAWSYSWTPAATGPYVLMSRAVGTDNKTETIMSADPVTASVSSVTPISASLSASASSVTVGGTVTFTASATGGVSPYQYQFMRKGPDTGGVYALARDWSASNTWSWAAASAAVGSNTVMVNVRNSDGTGQVSAVSGTITVSATVPTPAPTTSGLYESPYFGNPVSMSTLDPLYVGGSRGTALAAFRVRCSRGGELKSLVFYYLNGQANHGGPTGYSDAHAGDHWTITLRANNPANNMPSDTILASASFTTYLIADSSQWCFPVVQFSQHPTLVPGQIYHIVFENRSGYMSSADCLRLRDQKIFVDPIYALERYSNGSWKESVASGIDSTVGGLASWKVLPVYGLSFMDGGSEGIGYNEVGGSVTLGTVSATFTPKTQKVFKGANVLLSGSGSVKFTLATASGTVLASASSSTSGGWVRAKFASPVTLQAGVQYKLTITGSGTVPLIKTGPGRWNQWSAFMGAIWKGTFSTSYPFTFCLE